MPERCVFLDRDGTVNQEVCRLTEVSQFRLIGGAARAIGQLKAAGFRVVIVTNQAVIARGMLTEAGLRSIHDVMHRRLRRAGAVIDAVYYCPHHPTHGAARYRRRCDCRKPNSGMLTRAARDLNIDLTESYLVGDKLSDLHAGRRAGCQCVLVRTGHGRQHERILQEHNVRPDHIANNLSGAVAWILGTQTEREVD